MVARELGWPNVPPTVLRDGPEGVGLGAAVHRRSTRRSTTSRSRSEHADEFREGRAVRRGREQRRSQRGPLPARIGRHDLGGRPRGLLQRRAEAPHGDLGVRRRAASRPDCSRTVRVVPRPRLPDGISARNSGRCWLPASSTALDERIDDVLVTGRVPRAGSRSPVPVAADVTGYGSIVIGRPRSGPLHDRRVCRRGRVDDVRRGRRRPELDALAMRLESPTVGTLLEL